MIFKRVFTSAMLLTWVQLAVVAAAVEPLPGEIQKVLDKPLYKNGVWGLKVVDLESGEVIYELRPKQKLMTGSVRKLFSIGLALDKLGADHKFVTPIYRRGEVKDGVLHGDLILVASGDLAMGGRSNPDGSLAIVDYDHNEANSLGNAELTKPDVLAGFAALAKQVAAAGIKEVTGDVIIDDRLFEPFNFRGEFDVRPIFVNDDVVDVMISPEARVDWRPKSAAFGVEPELKLAAAKGEFTLQLEPECPQCLGTAHCAGKVAGELPRGFVPPLTDAYPLVRTFRIAEPQDFARTVLIEALDSAGVKVAAAAVAKNDASKLPASDSYSGNARVAELVSPPYREYAKWILKVSYNIGADTSLMLFGLTQGVRSMQASLDAERKLLGEDFHIAGDEFHFIDGSGGGDSAATPDAVVSFLRSMRKEKFFDDYRNALPILATDGSLGFVTDFQKDLSLSWAKGQVHAKTGTLLTGTDDGIFSLQAQTLAGYITAKSGRRLAFALFANDVAPIRGLEDVIGVFQDEGTISAIIWREN
ncbi:MAG: D-alanyl-D-alanine carboxypeptidase/D-alanyl-D-alanine-endopeptidase [Pirellulales bacterium]